MGALTAYLAALQLVFLAVPAADAGVRPCDFFANAGEFENAEDRSGILLWSWGRCGTGTLWDTQFGEQGRQLRCHSHQVGATGHKIRVDAGSHTTAA